MADGPVLWPETAVAAADRLGGRRRSCAAARAADRPYLVV